MTSTSTDNSRLLLTNARIATMRELVNPTPVIERGAIAVEGESIVWVGGQDDIPEPFTADATTLDLDGALLTPGLIDCHTHIVYAGNRVSEFEQLLSGVSYSEIANQGGGIVSTVNATRAADEHTLFTQSQQRLHALMLSGVTTIEIKSGYGLDPDTEARMLRVARLLGKDNAVDVHTTFLGAHTVPQAFKHDADAYIEQVCNEQLPVCVDEKLVDAVDAFCEGIAFSPRQVERVFKAAQRLDLPIKLHAEQLSDLKGAVLATQYQALSVDHLEFLAVEDVFNLKQAGTVAVLLPGAFYNLRETQLPPVEALREQAVPMAVATDCNPGSSPAMSLPLMMNMACTLFRLTPAEALLGTTRHAATALGRSDIGQLAPGYIANMAQWSVTDPAELSYHIGGNPCQRIWYRGVLSHDNASSGSIRHGAD